MIIRCLGALLLLISASSPAFAQLGPVPLGGLAVKPQAGTTARPLTQKLSDHLSLQDFGAVCDGVTDDSAAIRTAGATGLRMEIPSGFVCNGASIPQYTPFGNFVGPGQVKDLSGYLRGPVSGGVSAPPNQQAWNQTTSTADNCGGSFGCWAKFDYSHALRAEEYFINGATTLGQPVHGYEYMPGAVPHILFFNNSSGWNNSLTGNDGRTMAAGNRVIMQQNGGGDMSAYEAEISCGGTVKGPGGLAYTDWLAVPACGYQGGDISSTLPHQYMQMQEWHFADQGNDVAVVGSTMGYTRNSTTAPGLNNRWVDQLSTCNLFPVTGSLPCDAQHVVSGMWRIGLDFAEIDTHITAPIAMQAGQMITLNSAGTDGEGNPSKANLGGDWMVDDGSGIVFAQNGATTLRLANPANAVNAWQFGGSVSGNAIVIGPTGADAAIPVIMSDKGGSGVLFQSNGAIAMKISATTGASSYLNVAAGTAGAPLSLQAYGAGNQDLGLAAANSGLVRLTGVVPATGDASTAVPTTSFVRSAVSAMTGNRYKLFNVGAGASILLPVPAGVINEMIVEINPNAATIANMALTMLPTSSIPDGFIVHFMSTGTITTFVINANTSQTVLGTPGTINQTAPFALMWDASLAEWIQFR